MKIILPLLLLVTIALYFSYHRGNKLFNTPLNTKNLLSLSINDNALHHGLEKSKTGFFAVSPYKYDIQESKLNEWIEQLNEIKIDEQKNTDFIFNNPIKYLTIKTHHGTYVIEGHENNGKYGVFLKTTSKKGYITMGTVLEKDFQNLFKVPLSFRPFNLNFPPHIDKITYDNDKYVLTNEQQKKLLSLFNDLTFKEYVHWKKVDEDILKKFKVGVSINNNLKSNFKLHTARGEVTFAIGRPHLYQPNILRAWISTEDFILEGEFYKWADLLELEKQIHQRR